MTKPKAVLISDIHYNINTLPLADAALRQAIEVANNLQVPLIVAGDLHDTKANLRGECVQAMRETFKLCKLKPYVIVGNHDLINEKSKENSLSFLEDLVCLIEKPTYIGHTISGVLIPYHSNPDELRDLLKSLPNNIIDLIIMHQGIEDSNSGDYIQDKSAITKEDVKDFRVISGHYHARQDIKTGRPQKGAVGLFSYIGNPYTLTFGEANDPSKGFQILHDDGTLTHVPTNLRKHVIVNIEYNLLPIEPYTVVYNKEDLIWVKLTGTKEQLLNVTRQKVAKHLGVDTNFRLDLIPTDTETSAPESEKVKDGDLLDQLIDSLSNTSDDRKARLKELWRTSSCG